CVSSSVPGGTVRSTTPWSPSVHSVADDVPTHAACANPSRINGAAGTPSACTNRVMAPSRSEMDVRPVASASKTLSVADAPDWMRASPPRPVSTGAEPPSHHNRPSVGENNTQRPFAWVITNSLSSAGGWGSGTASPTDREVSAANTRTAFAAEEYIATRPEVSMAAALATYRGGSSSSSTSTSAKGSTSHAPTCADPGSG